MTGKTNITKFIEVIRVKKVICNYVLGDDSLAEERERAVTGKSKEDEEREKEEQERLRFQQEQDRRKDPFAGRTQSTVDKVRLGTMLNLNLQMIPTLFHNLSYKSAYLYCFFSLIQVFQIQSSKDNLT